MAIYSLGNEQEAKIYRQNWGRIFGKHQGSIYLIPTETDEVILQTDPNIRITCVLGEKTRKLKLSYFKADAKTSEVEIKTPQLLITHLLIARGSRHGEYSPCHCKECYPDQHNVLCNCPGCAKKRPIAHSIFYIWGFNEIKHSAGNMIHARPFHFANVYPQEGKICYGFQKLPTNLRHANNNFWGSTFNNDFKTATFSHTICDNKSRHSFSDHFYTHDHLGKRIKKHAGSCRKSVKHICGCSCPSKTRHSEGCQYRPYGCACACDCICCLGQCSCVCNCLCCRKTCHCHCDCDFNDEFAAQLRKDAYLQTYLRDETYNILGSKHIRTKNKIDGIFYTHEPSILKKVDPQYHRSDNSYTANVPRKYIIGMARNIPDDEWEITLEDGQVLLLCDKEVAFL